MAPAMQGSLPSSRAGAEGFGAFMLIVFIAPQALTRKTSAALLYLYLG